MKHVKLFQELTLRLTPEMPITSVMLEEIARLREELAAAQEDAARYRWLRENLDNTEALEELYEYPGDIPTAEEFDAAIDAAMKEGEQA